MNNAAMWINHLSPLYPTGPCVHRAFAEILNIILMSRHIMDVNRMLIERNISPEYGSLSEHFHWSFRNDCFTLWQRTEYNRHTCFPQRLIALHFAAIAAKDKEMDNISLN